MGIGLSIWLLGLLSGLCHASEVAWYVGRTVEEVQIEDVNSAELPSDMTPILRLQPGTVLVGGDVRSDIALLVRAGGFAAVEAYVEAVEPEDDVSAVRVVYRVAAAKRVKKMTVRGGRGRAAKRTILTSLGVDLGDPWFGQEDE